MVHILYSYDIKKIFNVLKNASMNAILIFLYIVLIGTFFERRAINKVCRRKLLYQTDDGIKIIQTVSYNK